MLDNKTILVTGASRGIGASCAEILLREGARVALTYSRAPGRIDDLVAAHGDRVLAIEADFSVSGTAAGSFENAVQHFGRIDGVVNNAGVAPQTDPDASLDEWHADWNLTLQVNLQSVADICKAAVGHFRQAGAGQIVNIASRAAFRGDNADSLHYAASKGGVVALTRSIARAWASDGIGAYIIAPGWVDTDMAGVIHQPGNEYMLDEIPLGRVADPAEIGEMVALLLTGKCMSATGTTIDINGASYVR